MKILICNAGSTSLKFKLYEMPQEAVLAECRIERVGSGKPGRFTYARGAYTLAEERVTPDYEAGIRALLALLCDREAGALTSVGEIAAVGFKTVLSKGFYGVHALSPEVMRGMEEYLTVAPAHNRHYLAAVRTFQKVLPDTPMIGAFETAFHQTMAPEAYTYAIPYEWSEGLHLRRLGYHGASHAYVADCLTGLLGASYKAVSCHLGGSSSLSAIVDGKSTENSFGLSLQAGLPQGNRAGDIDPFLIWQLMQAEGLTASEIFEKLQSQSGLLGISGVSGDMRDIEEAAAQGNGRAKLAFDVYCHELVRYIGGYAALMGGITALAFTGGIGENSAAVREHALEKLAFLGLQQAAQPTPLGTGGILELTAASSPVRAFVIPANEELGIARKVLEARLAPLSGKC